MSLNKKVKVEIEFKDTMRDVITGFLVCSDRLANIDDYVIGENTLTEKGKRLIRDNLVDTETPHHQIRKQLQLKLVIQNFPRMGVFEFDRHVLGIDSYQVDFFDENNVPTISSSRYSLHHIAKDDKIPEFIEKELDRSMIMYEKIVAKYFYIPEDDFSDVEERESWVHNRMEELSTIKFYKNMYKQSNDKLKKHINEYMYANTIYCKCTGEWLYNFLRQRLDKSAHYIIQELAKRMYEAIPEDFKDIFKVYKYQKIKPFSMDKAKLTAKGDRVKINMSVSEWENLQDIFSKHLVEKIYLV